MRVPRIVKILVILLLLYGGYTLLTQPEDGSVVGGEVSAQLLSVGIEGNIVSITLKNTGNAPISPSNVAVSTSNRCDPVSNIVIEPGNTGILSFYCPPGDFVEVKVGSSVWRKRLIR